MRILDSPNVGEQDDLLAENEPDLMANEQTWPTEEELAEADGGCGSDAVTRGESLGGGRR